MTTQTVVVSTYTRLDCSFQCGFAHLWYEPTSGSSVWPGGTNQGQNICFHQWHPLLCSRPLLISWRFTCPEGPLTAGNMIKGADLLNIDWSKGEDLMNKRKRCVASIAFCKRMQILKPRREKGTRLSPLLFLFTSIYLPCTGRMAPCCNLPDGELSFSTMH